MKDFVLLIVVLAAFIYGYFLMEKLDKFLKENQSFGFIIENSNDILKDEYCSLSLQIKQSVITPGSIDIAVHPINTIEKPARVIWQNDINCMKGLFVEKLRDFSERFLLSATRPNGKKEEKVV